jgi:hypothetical protein
MLWAMEFAATDPCETMKNLSKTHLYVNINPLNQSGYNMYHPFSHSVHQARLK